MKYFINNSVIPTHVTDEAGRKHKMMHNQKEMLRLSKVKI